MNDAPVVAQIKHNYVGLSETFIHRLVAGLRRVRPIVLTERVRNEDCYQFDRYYSVYQVGSDSGWLPRLVAKCARISRLAPEYSPLHARYSSYMLRHKAQIIHAHFGNTGWFCLPLARLHRLPLVVSFHGVDATALPLEPVWRSRFQELFIRASCVTAPSMYVATNLVQLGCSPSKLKVIRCGLNIDEWQYREPDRETSSVRRDVLMIARFVEKKGIPYAIEAVARVAERIPQVRLRIVGDGPMRVEIERLVVQLGVDRQVQLEGWMPNSEVARLMRESEVLIAPSVTASDGDQEGLPVSIIEAAATGIPVLATWHSGIPEIVRDEVSGFLVRERDADALAQKLLLLLENGELRARMGYAGRIIVEKEYTIAAAVEQLEQQYDRLLERT